MMMKTADDNEAIMMGINEYATDTNEEWPAIQCALKRLYSDFIVIEIPENGQILKPPTPLDEQNEVNSAKIEENQLYVEERNDLLLELPANEFKSEDIAKLKQVATGELSQTTIDMKDLCKGVRKKLYQFIASSYGDALFTQCEDGLLKVRKSNGKADESKKRRHWPEDRGGDYLHFTLTKENWDMHSAIGVICRKLRLKPSIFSISGTKDRRAVTVQRVCAYRVEQSKLQNVHIRGIWLSNFSYSDTKLQLGNTGGNHFSIILRDIDPIFGHTHIHERIEKWKHSGFLNYFGSQRFGSCGVNTADVGRLILLEDWEQAIRMLLSPRKEVKESINECLKCFADSEDASAALKLLPFGDNSANIERDLLTFLAKHPKAFKAAILALPRDVRTMYIHAYQSSVFNRIVSRRKKTFGLKVLPGDLDKNGALLDEPAAVIEHVCLPLPSTEPKLPNNDVARWYAEIAETDGLRAAEAYQKIERQFALSSSVYRPFVCRPSNVDWELLKYSTSSGNEPLQKCDFIPTIKQQQQQIGNPLDQEEKGGTKCKAENEGNLQGLKIKTALRIQFDLPPGTYATIALRELMRIDFSKQAQKAIEKEFLACNNVPVPTSV